MNEKMKYFKEFATVSRKKNKKKYRRNSHDEDILFKTILVLVLYTHNSCSH